MVDHGSIEEVRRRIGQIRQVSERGAPLSGAWSSIITPGQGAQVQQHAQTPAASSSTRDARAEAAAQRQIDMFVKQQKNRLAYIKETWAGKPRPKKDPAEVLSNHDSNPQLPNNSNTATFMIVIPKPYRPCVKSLRGLEAISLAQLRTESHHPGKVLLAKLTGLYTVGNSAFYTAVQDADGECEEVKVPAFCMGFDRSWPQKGAWVAIKEPYLTVDESMTQALMVVHPSDIVFIDRLPQELRPLRLLMSAKQTPATDALECKQRGNDLLKSREFVSAAARYSQGLQLLDTAEDLTDELQALERDLRRNRALACLSLRRFDEALQDAIAASTPASAAPQPAQDARAFSRAGRAAYNLRRYGEALDFFTKQLQIVAASEKDECQSWASRAEGRVREQASGSYDVSGLRNSATSRQPRLDAADYVSNVEIRDSPGRGRGLSATRDIAFGELILMEKAFCAVWSHEKESLLAYKFYVENPDTPFLGMLGLWKETMQYARNNPSEAAKLVQLHGDYPGTGKELITVDGTVVLDSFQVHDIVRQNAFGLSGFPDCPGSDVYSSGLFIKASHFNHSCVPTATRSFIGDLIMVSACKPIAKGEEITVSYGSTDEYKARSKEMQALWHFSCTCPLCEAEKADTRRTRTERGRLEKEAGAFLARYELRSGPNNQFSPAIVSAAEQLLQKILATYDEECFAGLPRLVAVGISYWLVENAWSLNHIDPRPLHAHIERHYKLLGYAVDMRWGRVVDIRPTANSLVPHDFVYHGLVPSYHAIKKASSAEARQKLIAFANGLSMAKGGTTELVDAMLSRG